MGTLAFVKANAANIVDGKDDHKESILYSFLTGK